MLRLSGIDPVVGLRLDRQALVAEGLDAPTKEQSP
jgi:hypothetical protein